MKRKKVLPPGSKNKKVLPQIGERVKFRDKNPNKIGERLMEGTVVEVSNKFGGIIYVGNITSSRGEWVVKLENLL